MHDLRAATRSPGHCAPARRTPAAAQRGVTLLEALVSLLVLALGMLSIGHLQTRLRSHAELARQTAEAARLAQQEMERLRAFSTLAARAGARAFDDIAAGTRVIDADSGSPSRTRYELAVQVDSGNVPHAKAMRIAVHWVDRAGAAQQITLDSLASASDPAWSGALVQSAARPAAPIPMLGRAASVPVEAKDLGDGTSVFKPASQGSVALRFDNASGAVTAVCSGIDPARRTGELGTSDLGGCAPAAGLLISGVARFSAASPADPALAHDTPLPLTIAVTPADGADPRPAWCATEALKVVRHTVAGQVLLRTVPIDAQPAWLGLAEWGETGDRHVAYHCVVTPTTGGWSGRLDLLPSGWAVGSAADAWRVCRYSADLDGSGAIDSNAEHPAQYVGVTAALTHQNFLVVRGSEACPTGAAGGRVSLVTAPHQP